jgi:hypothetical protein
MTYPDRPESSTAWVPRGFANRIALAVSVAAAGPNVVSGIAGERGGGKSSILDIIETFLTGGWFVSSGHHFQMRWSRKSTAVRLDVDGPYWTPVDREQVTSGHRLLITLGRTRVDSRGRRWSLDSPNTELNGPMMDASAST